MCLVQLKILSFLQFLNLICLFWELEDHVKQITAMLSTQGMVKLDCVCIDQKTMYGNWKCILEEISFIHFKPLMY